MHSAPSREASPANWLPQLAVCTILCVEILTLHRGHPATMPSAQLENLAVHTILCMEILTLRRGHPSSHASSHFCSCSCLIHAAAGTDLRMHPVFSHVKLQTGLPSHAHLLQFRIHQATTWPQATTCFPKHTRQQPGARQQPGFQNTPGNDLAPGNSLVLLR